MSMEHIWKLKITVEVNNTMNGNRGGDVWGCGICESLQ